MIIKQAQNTPVAAPSISMADEVLAAFCAYKGHTFLSLTDLDAFMQVPGTERDLFLSTLSYSVRQVMNDYVTVEYTV